MAAIFDEREVANELINSWLEESVGLGMTLQFSRLRRKIIDALNRAYEEGRSFGVREASGDGFGDDEEDFDDIEFFGDDEEEEESRG